MYTSKMYFSLIASKMQCHVNYEEGKAVPEYMGGCEDPEDWCVQYIDGTSGGDFDKSCKIT